MVKRQSTNEAANNNTKKATKQPDANPLNGVKVKIADFVKDKNICIYCGSMHDIEFDHIIARSRGGVTTAPACKPCNQSKSNKQLMEWLRWVKTYRTDLWEKICAHNKRKRNPIAKKVQKIRDER